MYGYIYKFTMIPTNKIYVGKRAKSKFEYGYWGSGTYWNRALAKYGKDNVIREVLEWCDSREELCLREKYWIKKLDSRNREIGYNIASGGDGGFLSDEARIAASLRRKGKAPWNKGLEATELAKYHLSESHKGLKTWNSGKVGVYSQESLNKMSESAIEDRGKRVLCIELNREFRSSKDACIELDLDVKHKKLINRCCCGYRKTAFNFTWRYL